MIAVGHKPASHFELITVQSHQDGDRAVARETLKIPATWLRTDMHCPTLENRWLLCVDATMGTFYMTDLRATNPVFKPYLLAVSIAYAFAVPLFFVG